MGVVRPLLWRWADMDDSSEVLLQCIRLPPLFLSPVSVQESELLEAESSLGSSWVSCSGQAPACTVFLSPHTGWLACSSHCTFIWKQGVLAQALFLPQTSLLCVLPCRVQLGGQLWSLSFSRWRVVVPCWGCPLFFPAFREQMQRVLAKELFSTQQIGGIALR